MSLRTRGRGIAAASSMMTSSAWPRTWESSGEMYWKVSLRDAPAERSAHLNGLTVSTEYIDADDSFPEVRVGALNDIIVDVLLVTKCIERLEDKLEKSFKIFGVGGCDEDVGVVVRKSSSDS